MMSPVVIDKPLGDDTRQHDPEVLIREARNRTRRRRMGLAAAFGVVVLGALTGLIVTHRAGSKLWPVTPSSPVTVNARAFDGHGVLAFVSKGSLYLLDGKTGRLVHLADPGHTASDPTLSHDGSWLAYLQEAGAATDEAGAAHDGDRNYQLWLARANGSDAHRVASVRNAQIAGWSPTRDTLAVINLPPQDWTCRSNPSTSVGLIGPAGAQRTVYSLRSTCTDPNRLYGAVWSPNGNSLAMATTNFKRAGGSRIFAIDLATGARRTWFTIRTTHRFPGGCGKYTCIGDEVVADLAGWWPKQGIGFWVFGNGMASHSDGSPLELIRAPGAKPSRLGTTLSDGTDPAVAAAHSGELAIVHATWRDVASGGTEVQVCGSGAAKCSAVPDASVWTRPASFPCHARHPYTYCYPPLKAGSPKSGVSLDPAWSPNGSLLAYVGGPAVPQDSSPTGRWLDYHELYLYNPATAKARELASTAGASVPQWSADGRSILYVSHDSLWLLNVRAGRSARIAGPLFGGASFARAYDNNSFYHQLPFTAQFGWSS